MRYKPGKAVMNVIEAAQYLDVSTITIYRLIGQKKMPHKRVGKLIRFSKVNLDRWLRN